MVERTAVLTKQGEIMILRRRGVLCKKCGKRIMIGEIYRSKSSRNRSMYYHNKCWEQILQ